MGWLLSRIDDNIVREAKFQSHKTTVLGDTVLKQCWDENHYALCLITKSEDCETGEDMELLYTYLGRGVPHQPPHCFPLVFKRMPLNVADLLYAHGLHYLGFQYSPKQIFVKPEVRDRETIFDDRIFNISCNLDLLAHCLDEWIQEDVVVDKFR